MQNPEQSADEDAEKNEEDSEGERRRLLKMIGRPEVMGSLDLVSVFNLGLQCSGFFPFHFLTGSSDEDEDDDGVSGTAFLKKKPDSSGESRKFHKKMEVRFFQGYPGGDFLSEYLGLGKKKYNLMGS